MIFPGLLLGSCLLMLVATVSEECVDEEVVMVVMLVMIMMINIESS